VEIKPGVRISLAELEKSGYKKLYPFGEGSWIMGKGEERLLYNPETETVGVMYTYKEKDLGSK
jgi:hypothetical protein